MNAPTWEIQCGDGPLVAAAIHAGHELRPAILPCVELSAADRLREEDPFTDELTAVASTRVIVHRSRFEFDLNRPPESAVYRQPADAWGLSVWKGPLAEELAAQSRRLHEQFYAEVAKLLTEKIDTFGMVVVLDLHSYNHRRGGPDAPPADAASNPDINIGTGSMPIGEWDRLVTEFMQRLRYCEPGQRPLDVRENVRFRGGYFPKWIHATFPRKACAIAIEFKKTFMNEWTGEVDRAALEHLRRCLQRAVQSIGEAVADRSTRRTAQARSTA